MKDSAQEQLIAMRRGQILDAATTVFARKGFHPTTIKDIAREAGIADGTIYNYFENKTALLLGILDRMNESDRREGDFAQFTVGDFRSFMTAYFRHRLQVFKVDNFELFRVVISEIMVNKELRELYYHTILEPTLSLAEKYFQQWTEERLIRTTNRSLAMRATSAMVLGLILQYIMGDTALEEQWDAIPDFLTDLLMEGLAPHSHEGLA